MRKKVSGCGCACVWCVRACARAYMRFSHTCYIWIVNNITNCNTCLFSVSDFFYSILE